MQRNKSLTLVADIFNKLSSISFISKTCPTHQTSLPLYICTHCFPTKMVTLCEQCFKEHQCDKKSKGEISRWVSEQQAKIGKDINAVFKEFDSNRQVFLSGKIKIRAKDQQRYISDINNEIVTGVVKKLEGAQKNIEENCIKPVLEGPLKSSLQTYASSIKIKLNGLSGNLSEIYSFVDFCDLTSKQVQLQIQKESKEAVARSCKFYKESVQQILSQIFTQVLGQEKLSVLNSKQEDVNDKIKNSKVEYLLKEIDAQKSLIADLEDKIVKIQSDYKAGAEERAELIKINRHIIAQGEQQQRTNLKKQSELEQKLKQYLGAVGESEQKDNCIKKLEDKLKVYETQIAQMARSNVSHTQKPQSRYNLQQMANRLTELGEQNSFLIIECSGKDKKIAQLVAEINKMKIRKNEERLQHSSGKKMNFPA